MTVHIWDVLPQGTPFSKVPSTRFSCSDTQCREAAGTLHVLAFLVLDSGGLGGNGAVSSL